MGLLRQKKPVNQERLTGAAEVSDLVAAYDFLQLLTAIKAQLCSVPLETEGAL